MSNAAPQLAESTPTTALRASIEQLLKRYESDHDFAQELELHPSQTLKDAHLDALIPMPSGEIRLSTIFETLNGPDELRAVMATMNQVEGFATSGSQTPATPWPFVLVIADAVGTISVGAVANAIVPVESYNPKEEPHYDDAIAVRVNEGYEDCEAAQFLTEAGLTHERQLTLLRRIVTEGEKIAPERSRLPWMGKTLTVDYSREATVLHIANVTL